MPATPVTEGYSSLAEWLDYLERLHPSSIDMGLERVSQVAHRLFDFSSLPPVITVTGTNGKGSTVMSMEAMARAHGQRTGAYMSPHLLRYNERVRIDGDPVSDAVLIESFQAVERARAAVSLTYFEFGTLSALWLFARERLDLLLLEVGLGGRLDAVNIVDPRVAVITSIALDHEAWLGSTRESVCHEKAGIRRAGVPLVCGERQPPENLFALCAATATPLLLLGRDFEVSTGGFTGVTADLAPAEGTTGIAELSHWKVPENGLLPDNMACALQALQVAGIFPLNLTLAWQALATLVIPGRRQLLQRAPKVYVDVGHNPHAALSLAAWIKSTIRQPGNGRVIGLVGMLSDKDYQGTLEAMASQIDLWQPVSLGGPRGLSGEQLATTLRALGAAVLPAAASPVAGLGKILEQVGNGDTIIGFGSFYTVSDLMAHYASGAHGH